MGKGEGGGDFAPLPSIPSLQGRGSNDIALL